jgi:3-oxoacyl-[acyl-carrier-protein] synthase-3
VLALKTVRRACGPVSNDVHGEGSTPAGIGPDGATLGCLRLKSAFRIGYLGHGARVPDTEFTNADLERLVDTNDAWIRRRTGVRTRRVLDDRETILEMAAKASRQALERAGLEPGDIDAIRVATSTWLRLPSLATALQQELGIGDASACDVAAGCAGFVYAVEDAWHQAVFERTAYDRRTHALVVGVDGLSHITDYNDRGTCVLLGDGAGAVVLGEVERGGILATHTRADGRYGHLLYSERANGYRPPSDGAPSVGEGGPQQLLRMDGRRVFVAAVETMVEDVGSVLEKYRAATGRSLGLDEVDFVYPHQANSRILEMVAQRLGLPLERMYRDGIVRYGNTSAASIPLGYVDTSDRVREGTGPWYEIDVAFGAGFASGAILRECA